MFLVDIHSSSRKLIWEQSQNKRDETTCNPEQQRDSLTCFSGLYLCLWFSWRDDSVQVFVRHAGEMISVR